MANYIDAGAIDALARRLSARIPLARPRARAERLFYAALYEDPRCARAPNAAEAAAAPDWARRAEALAAFEPHPDAVGALRRIARHVKDSCVEWNELSEAPRDALTTRDIVVRQLAGEFLAKIERMPIDIVADKAKFFSRERAQRLKELKANRPLFEPETLYAAPGRVWTRVISVGELSSLGREFGNCLARATRHHLSYARRLKLDQARFWVLRDQTGAGRMIAMIETVTARLVEARGVRNASVAPNDPDLEALLRASALAAMKAIAEQRARIELGAQSHKDARR